MNKSIRPRAGKGERSWDNLLLPDGVKREDIVKLAGPKCPPPLPPIIITAAEFNLKNMKEGLSHETVGFEASVFVNGKKVGYAFNEGTGGGSAVQPFGVENREPFLELEDWASALPPSSSANRIYESILLAESKYMEGVPKDDASLLTTSGVALDDLAEDWVQRKLAWKDLGREIVVGPGGANTLPTPGFISSKKVIKSNADVLLLRVQQQYEWAVRMRAFLELPLHYYPAPHPFAHSNGWKQHIVHKESGRVGWAGWGTTDDKVELAFTEWEWGPDREPTEEDIKRQEDGKYVDLREKVHSYPAIKGYREEAEIAEKADSESFAPAELEFYSAAGVTA